MKKQLLAALTASMIVAGAGTVFAADDSTQGIQFDGSLSVHYRDQHDTDNGGAGTRTAWKTTLTLNVDAPLVKNLDAYATLTYQGISTTHSAGFVADYTESGKSVAALSAYGLKYKNAGYSYVVGSQLMTFGGGLVYDNGYIGRNDEPYALNVSKKVGATNLNLILAQTHYQSGISNDKFYVLQGNYDVSPTTNIGAMFAHVSYGDSTYNEYYKPGVNVNFDKNVNFYSIYGSQKLSDPLTLSVEYLVGSTDKDNQAYQANLSYALDSKNTLSAGYYRVEDQANISDYNAGDMTTAPNNNTKGYSVAWKHSFQNNLSLKVGYLNYNTIISNSVTGPNANRSRLYTTATVTF